MRVFRAWDAAWMSAIGAAVLLGMVTTTAPPGRGDTVAGGPAASRAVADDDGAGDAEPAGPTVALRLFDDEEWEGAVADDVRAVLGSVVDAMVPHVPQAGAVALEVRPRGGPISLFERAPDGAVRVHLNTGGNLWAQYSYQFAHELCHVLCRFDRDDTGNRWFEEALCEVASLFTLRRMADAWRTTPPYPNWQDYSAALDDYADRIIEAGRLPEGMSLADWYARHRDELPTRPTDREHARVVAVALLPVFEAQPEHWAAIPWLNAAAPVRPQSFAAYLDDWRRQAPAEQAWIIESLARAFAVRLPATARR
jgi:hypothetical protein